MNRVALSNCLLLILSVSVKAQSTSDLHQQTTSPPNARFEIVQSELAAKWTFRLDRFTGRVAQLVKTKSGDDAWEEMQVIGLQHPSAPTRARFQIFTSRLAAKFTFLIDTDNGKTWVVVSNKDTNPDGTEYDFSVWEPFAGDN